MAISLTDTPRIENLAEQPTDSSAWSLSQRLQMEVFNFKCRLALAQFQYRTRSAAETNERTLHNILRCNRDTEFGRGHEFGGMLRTKGNLMNAFYRSVPLSIYDDYEHYVARIASGEENILSADPVLILAGSGGTTDRPKRIPRTRGTQRHHTMLVVRAEQAVVNRGIPGANGPDRGINLMSLYAPPLATGSVVPQISGPNAGIRRVRRQIPLFWSSPEAVFGIEHQPTALYLHALFGLLNRRTLYIETPFAPQVVGWFTLIERHQRQLFEDMRTGTLSAHLELSGAARQTIAPYLRQNPSRAEEVLAAFAQGFQGIIPRLWPNIKYIRTVTSGSFALSLPRLRWLASPDLTIHSGCHASSEGVIGINLKTDGSNDYVLALGSAFFEFIPFAQVDKSQPQTVALEALQPGEEYEVVLTNCAGLYRYGMGDVVRITGRYGTAPTFNYLYRRGTILNLVGEKTTEYHTASALGMAMHGWLGTDRALRDYSVAGGFDGGLGRYIFYVELQIDTPLPSKEMRTAARLLDEALCQTNPYYLSNGRAPERLAPAQLKLVKPGTFDALVQLQLQRADNINLTQVKVPRVVTCPEYIRLLEDSVLLGQAELHAKI